MKIKHFNRQRKQARKDFGPISKQEVRVLEHLRNGKTAKEIGRELFIAPSTVSTHIHNVSKKWKVNKETALVNKYVMRKFGNLDF